MKPTDPKSIGGGPSEEHLLAKPSDKKPQLQTPTAKSQPKANPKEKKGGAGMMGAFNSLFQKPMNLFKGKKTKEKPPAVVPNVKPLNEEEILVAEEEQQRQKQSLEGPYAPRKTIMGEIIEAPEPVAEVGEWDDPLMIVGNGTKEHPGHLNITYSGTVYNTQGLYEEIKKTILQANIDLKLNHDDKKERIEPIPAPKDYLLHDVIYKLNVTLYGVTWT